MIAQLGRLVVLLAVVLAVLREVIELRRRRRSLAHARSLPRRTPAIQRTGPRVVR